MAQSDEGALEALPQLCGRDWLSECHADGEGCVRAASKLPSALASDDSHMSRNEDVRAYTDATLEAC